MADACLLNEVDPLAQSLRNEMHSSTL